MFRPFPKIFEKTSQWNLNEEQTRLCNQQEWVVTEKIHGANFCLCFDGTQLQPAKRKSLLNEDDPFFFYPMAIKFLQPKMPALFRSIHEKTNAVQIFVYGELFGGHYPHQEVKEVPEVQPVQTGVWYSPSIEFHIFDVAVWDGERHFFLDFEDMSNICAQHKIPSVEPLFVGCFADAIGYNERFESTIASRLGLPQIEHNLAEGVVIKSVKELSMSVDGSLIRPVLKKKIKEFSEDKKFTQSKKTDGSSLMLTPLQKLEWEMSQMVNINRFESATSKLGYVTKSNQDEIASEMLDDIWKDLCDFFPFYVSMTSLEDEALLREVLADLVGCFVENILENQGGNERKSKS